MSILDCHQEELIPLPLSNILISNGVSVQIVLSINNLMLYQVDRLKSGIRRSH